MGPELISRTPIEEVENCRNQLHHRHHHQAHCHHDLQSPSHEQDDDHKSDDPDYLFQLVRDKRTLQSMPNYFLHMDRLLDEEITRVHNNVLYLGTSTEPLILPEAQGPVITLSEKLAVPVTEYPDFNFVGRLLGPRGMTAKQLEIETGCRILVRGRGSLRDKRKEEQMKGKTKWEHLNEDLHVLISVEDSRNRAQIKMNRAIEQIQKLLVPSSEGEDELKKRQLLELALLNGTYKGLNNNNITCPPLFFHHPAAVNGQFSPTVGGFDPGLPGHGGMMGPGHLTMPMLIRTSDAAGMPIILPHPLPIFSPTSMTPLSSPIGPPPGVTSPGGLLSPTGEPPGFLFHLEPCLMSPTSPSTPIIENPLHKPPPLIIQQPPISFQHQFQQQQQLQFQHQQQDLTRSAGLTILSPGSVSVTAPGIHGAGPSSLFFSQR